MGFGCYVNIWQPTLEPWLFLNTLTLFGFSLFGYKLFPDTLSWRLRHWSAEQLLAFYGGNSPLSFKQADQRNLLALLMDPDTAERVASRDKAYPDLARQQAFVYDAVEAIVRGMPRQSLLLIADARQEAGTKAVGLGYVQLIQVVEIMAEIMIGTLSPAQFKQLNDAGRGKDGLVACFAAWALAHYHLAEGHSAQADALFADLVEKASSLRAFHVPAGTLSAVGDSRQPGLSARG